MGETVVRAVTAIGTGGASELLREKPFQPGGNTSLKGALTSLAVGGLGTGVLAASGTKIDQAKNAPIVAQAVKPGMTDDERERLARIARDQRRKEFQNLGRSGTMLTGPGGLTGSGPGAAKTLLGY